MAEAGSRATRLAVGLQRLGLELSAQQQQSLLDYIDLLVKWNRAYNLTAVRDADDMVPKHLLDSLAVSPFLRGEHILDVGTGAGLPGIPMAIANPRKQFHLLDSNGKKTRFVIQTVAELGLGNVQVTQVRVQDFKPHHLFDLVIARAFASLSDIISQTTKLCRPGGLLLAMKGKDPAPELAEAGVLPGAVSVHGLQVPFLDAERHLIEVVVGDDSREFPNG